MEHTIALEIQNVSKHFNPGAFNPLKRNGAKKPVLAVNDISITVQRGEIFGVLGPNGSGKSTFIRLISTLLVPDAGSVNIFGLDIERDERAVQRLINRVSVEAAFFKKLSPLENLLYGARLYGLSGADARAKIEVILKRLDLRADAINRPMEEMSRGMQQKVAIARALLTAPILLLLDEPTTGLDPRSKREVQTLVRELRDTHDATIVLTTHDMLEADGLCDRIAIIDAGRIVALDTPVELKKLVAANGHVPTSDSSAFYRTLGHEPTLEEVFLQLTGKKLVEDK
ncbi:MAG: ABC transporter ATP-binding protein [Chloroflexi bacterium]|nr:ABC transporter ATP-binding protein [Chloroflexota bacterium]